MSLIRTSVLILMLVLTPSLLAIKFPTPFLVNRVNRSIQGTVIDYTNYTKKDNRIWSESLSEKRNLLLYLPPNYDAIKAYPLLIWLHGFSQDESMFIDYFVKPFDAAISVGKLSPMIIASPDGNLHKDWKLIPRGSFFINSNAGKYEDFIVKDVIGFITKNYVICPEKEAHSIGGTSMGGAGAYHLGIKHNQYFKNIVGIYPPLNTRYMDQRGSYMGNFNPSFTEFRTDFSNGHMTVGKFLGFFLVKAKIIQSDLFNIKDPNVAKYFSAVNPTEMLDHYHIEKDMLNFYLAYGRKDQFNLDAHAESFLHYAKNKNIYVEVDYNPQGKHDNKTAVKFLPKIIDWLSIQHQGQEPK